jgi:hypothetical protein
MLRGDGRLSWSVVARKLIVRSVHGQGLSLAKINRRIAERYLALGGRDDLTAGSSASMT